MTVKEKFLKINDYEEFEKRRSEFSSLDYTDEEVIEHYCDIFPPLESSGYENGIIYEVKK